MRKTHVANACVNAPLTKFLSGPVFDKTLIPFYLILKLVFCDNNLLQQQQQQQTFYQPHHTFTGVNPLTKPCLAKSLPSNEIVLITILVQICSQMYASLSNLEALTLKIVLLTKTIQFYNRIQRPMKTAFQNWNKSTPHKMAAKANQLAKLLVPIFDS